MQSTELSINEVTKAELPKLFEIIESKLVKERLTFSFDSPADFENEFSPYIDDQKKIERKHFLWAIRKSDKIVGCIGMDLFAKRFKLSKIFFFIAPEEWGKGYATSCTKRIINYGFGQLKLNRIEAGAETSNIGSIKVLENCNMINEGVRRSLLPINNQWKDCFQYSILSSDPRNY